MKSYNELKLIVIKDKEQHYGCWWDSFMQFDTQS